MVVFKMLIVDFANQRNQRSAHGSLDDMAVVSALLPSCWSTLLGKVCLDDKPICRKLWALPVRLGNEPQGHWKCDWPTKRAPKGASAFHFAAIRQLCQHAGISILCDLTDHVAKTCRQCCMSAWSALFVDLDQQCLKRLQR